MSPVKLNQVTDAVTADSPWRSLYPVGGVAALLSVALIPVQIVIFIAWPPPAPDAIRGAGAGCLLAERAYS